MIELKNRVGERIDVDFKDLVWFQGGLKILSEKKAQTLKNAIEQSFINPFLIWDDNGKFKILDGHQRHRILESNDYKGKVPCVKIHCQDEKEAAKFVLEFASVYGQADYETLYKFVNDYDLEIDYYQNVVDMPYVNMEEFRIGYIQDGEDLSNFFIDRDLEKKEKKNEGNEKTICPECGVDITGRI